MERWTWGDRKIRDGFSKMLNFIKSAIEFHFPEKVADLDEILLRIQRKNHPADLMKSGSRNRRNYAVKGKKDIKRTGNNVI